MKTLLLLLLSFTVFANEKLETNSFKEIEKKALSKAKKYGVKNVLVVLDIDNTVLKMPQHLGSDQWWGWQSGKDCIGNKKPAKHCATNKFGELLQLQGELFAISKMLPTEKATASVIENLQKKGFKVILLTSRGPDFRNATFRELKRNGMMFAKSAIGPKGGYPSTYKPYTLKNFKKFGLTKQDIKSMGKKKARKVSFQDGIYMTAGLNKGIMLKTLLHKTGSKFKAIIFADDHERHHKRMHAIMGKVKGVDLTTYRYTAVDPEVNSFKKSNKKETKAALKAYLQLRKTYFK